MTPEFVRQLRTIIGLVLIGDQIECHSFPLETELLALEGFDEDGYYGVIVSIFGQKPEHQLKKFFRKDRIEAEPISSHPLL